MSRTKEEFRIRDVDTRALVSDLRGEVGGLLSDLTMTRGFLVETLKYRDTLGDESVECLCYLRCFWAFTDRVVLGLVRLADKTTTRTCFWFLGKKTGWLGEEIKSYISSIKKSALYRRRQLKIGHKEFPSKYAEVTFPEVVKEVDRAVKLMEKIDFVMLGLESRYLWREMRKKRREDSFTALQGEIAYKLLPYLRLSDEDYLRISEEEKGV